MTWMPEPDLPGSGHASPDSWNIERMWNRPLARLVDSKDAGRLPGSAETRPTPGQRTRRIAVRAANGDRIAAARARLLAELARIDSDDERDGS